MYISVQMNTFVYLILSAKSKSIISQPIPFLLRIDLGVLDAWKPRLHGAGDGATKTILC